MSEVTDQLPQESQADAAPTGNATAGETLRQAREAAGMSLATLAVALKVSVKRLEALEADRLDLLPDAVFVRALASSVCHPENRSGSSAESAAAERRAAT